MNTAYAIFDGDNSHWLAWTLKPGFRHVWAVVPDVDGDAWVGISLGLTGLELTNLERLSYDIRAHYERMGDVVIALPYTPQDRVMLPFIANSCVGLTKAVLGIRHWAWTPHQLHQHLMKDRAHVQSHTSGLQPGRQEEAA